MLWFSNLQDNTHTKSIKSQESFLQTRVLLLLMLMLLLVLVMLMVLRQAAASAARAPQQRPTLVKVVCDAAADAMMP